MVQKIESKIDMSHKIEEAKRMLAELNEIRNQQRNMITVLEDHSSEYKERLE